MRPEDFIADKKRPFTGAEYIESLRDGREVYIDGERVADVTVHPAFRNAIRSIARLYDALHDPQSKDRLTCPTDTGSGGYTHKYFRVPRSREDLVGARAADDGADQLPKVVRDREPVEQGLQRRADAPDTRATAAAFRSDHLRTMRALGTSGRRRRCRL